MTDLADRTTTSASAPPAPPSARSPLAAGRVSTVDQAIERFESVQTWLHVHAPRRTRDGLACFNHLYTVITKRVREWIGQGKFDDAAFLTALDVAFANRYLAAVHAEATAPGSAPSSWDALIEHRSDWHTSRMRFAVAGVNAHVNFDLPFAVVTACEAVGSDLDEGTHRADYQKVNEIFALEMQGLRRSYESGLVRWIDEHLLGHVENVFDDFAVDKARDAAWGHAEVLWRIRHDEAATRTYECSLDSVVGLAGRGILAHL